MTKPAGADTTQRILDVAERLVQTQGWCGFSYADIAAALDIRKASIHHHFPTKANLGRTLMARYHATFAAALDQITLSPADCASKLDRYAGLYSGVLSDDNRMCLCGMLAADFETLPAPLRADIQAFFELNERWLAGVISAGRKAKTLRFRGSPEVEARLLLSSLQGAMLVARTFGDVARFETVARQLLGSLTRAPAGAVASLPRDHKREAKKRPEGAETGKQNAGIRAVARGRRPTASRASSRARRPRRAEVFQHRAR
jgi:TetR/AcrR family transcriptional repressor of nem operon